MSYNDPNFRDPEVNRPYPSTRRSAGASWGIIAVLALLVAGLVAWSVSYTGNQTATNNNTPAASTTGSGATSPAAPVRPSPATTTP